MVTNACFFELLGGPQDGYKGSCLIDNGMVEVRRYIQREIKGGIIEDIGVATDCYIGMLRPNFYKYSKSTIELFDKKEK